MKSTKLEELARQAFAVAVQKAFPNADPKAEEVRVSCGESSNRYLCEWDGGDLSVSGRFHHWFFHPAKSGVVFLDLAQYSDMPFWESLFAQRKHFSDIPKAYAEYRNQASRMCPASA